MQTALFHSVDEPQGECDRAAGVSCPSRGTRLVVMKSELSRKAAANCKYSCTLPRTQLYGVGHNDHFSSDNLTVCSLLAANSGQCDDNHTDGRIRCGHCLLRPRRAEGFARCTTSFRLPLQRRSPQSTKGIHYAPADEGW